ncbi:MAG TPA: hypothetical protein VIZ18_19800 [Ktedonobacteraceae bacterium]
MAQIPNTNAFSEGDGLNTYVNIDTVNKLLQVMNGAAIKLYSDAGVTLTAQIAGGGVAPAQSATAVAIANTGTIATANIGVSRVSPASAVTGVILAAGTIPGQLVWVVNEAVATNSVTFAASGTSNVADGVNDILSGLQSRLYVWDSATSLWYPVGNPLVSGGLQPTIASSTAPDPGAGGTVATAGIGRSRVSPAANRTACILAAGTFDGQEVWVTNEAASFTLSWATQATSNIGGEAGGTFVLAAKGAQKFVWDANDNLWHKAA